MVSNDCQHRQSKLCSYRADVNDRICLFCSCETCFAGVWGLIFTSTAAEQALRLQGGRQRILFKNSRRTANPPVSPFAQVGIAENRQKEKLFVPGYVGLAGEEGVGAADGGEGE